MTETRYLSDIATEIVADWRKKDGTPNVYFGAVPYLQAMLTMDTVHGMFGMDTADSIVRYFLANATTWRGPVARRIKAELKAML